MRNPKSVLYLTLSESGTCGILLYPVQYPYSNGSFDVDLIDFILNIFRVSSSIEYHMYIIHTWVVLSVDCCIMQHMIHEMLADVNESVSAGGVIYRLGLSPVTAVCHKPSY